MKMYKYDGKIYEGRWKVVERKKFRYVLENIYNGSQIEVCERTLRRIDNGETTVSKNIFLKMLKEGKSKIPW